jgi:UDP:flavonoid glycosyltransferase YjiC (YdhE family)
MSRIAFVWELGSSYGHISALLPFVRALRLRGHEAVLVVRELHNTGSIVTEGIDVLQAPIWLPQVQGLQGPPLNYSEILMNYGYLVADGLTGLVGAWRSLFSLTGCDAIVANHAPTALLAARSLGLPAMTLGTGFHLPPNIAPMPNMRPWLNVQPGRFEQSDALVLNNMNAVLAKYGADPMSGVGELFAADENFLCTFAELDHYPQRAPCHYHGVSSNVEMGQEVAWPPGAAKCVFVYLEPHQRDLSGVLQAIAALGLRAVVCAPGIADSVKRAHETQRIIISAQPFRLANLLQECGLAIGYGGHGMTANMLLAGVPLLLLPTQLERFLMATRVVAMGAGIAVHPEVPSPDYANLIRTLLDVPDYREHARLFAQKYAGFDPVAQQQTIAARIEEIAARKQATA